MTQSTEAAHNGNSGQLGWKQLASIIAAIIVFISLYFGLPEDFTYAPRVMTALVCFAIVLWAFEPIPLGATGLIVLVLMLVFRVADTSVTLSGFASPAIFLIIGGTMIVIATNETPLIRRMTYNMLAKFGSTSKGLVWSLLIILQIQAIFIPAVAVRTTLMIPITSMIAKTVGARPGSNLQRILFLTLAFGGTVSGVAIMTAAVSNVLTVEILNRYANINVTYFEWFLYTFPIWFLMIPTVGFLLLKMYPVPTGQQHHPKIKQEMKQKIEELGPITNAEKRASFILLLTVGLWLTEPFHGMHPSISALIGAALMALPVIGCGTWKKMVQMNYDTILLLSVTLSVGYVFVDSGATDLISNYVSTEGFLKLLQHPVLGLFIIIFLTQIFHKMISNVSTAVITLLPIVLSIATVANFDPLFISMVVGVTCLFGFILAVESMPNLLIHSTGAVTQKDFILPGFYLTIISSVITVIIALTWWQWVGLY